MRVHTHHRGSCNIYSKADQLLYCHDCGKMGQPARPALVSQDGSAVMKAHAHAHATVIPRTKEPPSNSTADKDNITLTMTQTKTTSP